jgi:acyl transferase domain-containing protein
MRIWTYLTDFICLGLLLECAFEAAENAGLALDKLSGSNTGVFSSQEQSEYGEQMTENLP